jgi:hypothetical protein
MSHLGNLARASFDFGLYREVQRQRLRRTFAHLLILVLLSTVTTAIVVALATRGVVDRLLPEVDKIPTIVIRDGEASVNVPQPWVKRLGRDEKSGKEVVLILDTTGTISDFRENEMGLFLAKRELRARGPEGKTRAVLLKRFGDREIGPRVVREWLVRARVLVPLGVAVLALFYFWVVKGLQALFLTLIGLIAATGRRRPLGFGALWAIGVYALTPAVLADCALWLAPVTLGKFWLLYWLIAIIYTIVAVRLTPDDPKLTLV